MCRAEVNLILNLTRKVFGTLLFPSEKTCLLSQDIFDCGFYILVDIFHKITCQNIQHKHFILSKKKTQNKFGCQESSRWFFLTSPSHKIVQCFVPIYFNLIEYVSPLSSCPYQQQLQYKKQKSFSTRISCRLIKLGKLYICFVFSMRFLLKGCHLWNINHCQRQLFKNIYLYIFPFTPPNQSFLRLPQIFNFLIYWESVCSLILPRFPLKK